MQLIRGALPSEATTDLARFAGEAPQRDGRATAGTEGQGKKEASAVRPDAPGYAEAARRIERLALSDPRVGALAFPRAVSTPQFLTYGPGGRYDAHRDHPFLGGVRGVPVRGDVSATLFLNDAYEGGGLTVGGASAPRGEPGDLLLYDGGQAHAVAPVTEGRRVVAVFWIESFVARAEDRALLRDYDAACAPVRRDGPDAVRSGLSDVYVRLLRRLSS